MIITDSGTSSYVIVISFGELQVDSLTLDNPASGQGLYILSIDGSVVLSNVKITRGVVYESNKPKLFWYKPIYFTFLVCQADLQNVTISDSTIPMGPMFSMVFSLRNIHISKVTIGSVLLSSRTVCDMVIDKVDGNMQTFLGGSSAVNFLSNTSAE